MRVKLRHQAGLRRSRNSPGDIHKGTREYRSGMNSQAGDTLPLFSRDQNPSYAPKGEQLDSISRQTGASKYRMGILSYRHRPSKKRYRFQSRVRRIEFWGENRGEGARGEVRKGTIARDSIPRVKCDRKTRMLQGQKTKIIYSR